MKTRLHLLGRKITLGILTFCLSFGFVNQVQSQQFVNGKLVRKEKFPGGGGDTYLKYGADYKNYILMPIWLLIYIKKIILGNII